MTLPSELLDVRRRCRKTSGPNGGPELQAFAHCFLLVIEFSSEGLCADGIGD